METDLLNIEIQINKMLEDFQKKHNCVIGAINEDYTAFDNDKAHDGLRGSIVQLSVITIEA